MHVSHTNGFYVCRGSNHGYINQRIQVCGDGNE